MLAGRQENQTPRAEKQSPEKTKPGEIPRAFTTSILSPDPSQRPSKHSSYSTNRYHSNSRQTCKKGTTKNNYSTSPPPHHPVTLHGPTSKTTRAANDPPPAQLPPSDSKTSKKNYKPPLPPTCFSLQPDYKKELQVLQTTPTRPTASLQTTSKKNFRYFKPPLPNPTSESLRLQTCKR